MFSSNLFILSIISIFTSNFFTKLPGIWIETTGWHSDVYLWFHGRSNRRNRWSQFSIALSRAQVQKFPTKRSGRGSPFVQGHAVTAAAVASRNNLQDKTISYVYYVLHFMTYVLGDPNTRIIPASWRYDRYTISSYFLQVLKFLSILWLHIKTMLQVMVFLMTTDWIEKYKKIYVYSHIGIYR